MTSRNCGVRLSLSVPDAFSAAAAWLGAAACALNYVKEMQRCELPHIQSLQVEQQSESVVLDAASRRNLELDINLSGGRQNTLLSVMDH